MRDRRRTKWRSSGCARRGAVSARARRLRRDGRIPGRITGTSRDRGGRGATWRVVVVDASTDARVRGAPRGGGVFTGAQERAACDRVLKMARAPSSRRGGARIGRTYLVAGGRVRGGSRRGAGRGDTRGRRGHGLAQRDGQLLALREHLGGDAHLRTARPRRRSRGPRETETRVEPTENALDESARGASATRVSVKGVERARAPVDVSSARRRGSDEGRRVENDSSRFKSFSRVADQALCHIFITRTTIQATHNNNSQVRSRHARHRLLSDAPPLLKSLRCFLRSSRLCSS